MKECVVIAREHNRSQSKVDVFNSKDNILQALVAYVRLDKSLEELPTSSESRSFVEERMPRFMVPAFFAIIDKFPCKRLSKLYHLLVSVNENGKLDRKALPAPEETQSGRKRLASSSELLIEAT